MQVLVIPGHNSFEDEYKPYTRGINHSSLTEMQEIVEGYIEPIDLVLRYSNGEPRTLATRHFTMWVNEEFTYRFGTDDTALARFNGLACMTAASCGRPEFVGYPILGNVFLTGPTDRKGECTSIAPEVVQAVESMYRNTRKDTTP